MKKTILSLVVLMSCGVAMSTEAPPPKSTNSPAAVAAAKARAASRSQSSASAEGGDAKATGGVAGAGAYVEASNRAATAYAAPVQGTNGTCLGGVSGGVQGGVGVSFSSTTLDKGCNARYDALALDAMGLRQAAIARLCQQAENAQAMEDAGTPCPVPKKVAVSTTAPTSQASDLKLLP